jgi:hypothetical protein
MVLIVASPAMIPTTANAAVSSKRCAWWELEGETETALVIGVPPLGWTAGV